MTRRSLEEIFGSPQINDRTRIQEELERIFSGAGKAGAVSDNIFEQPEPKTRKQEIKEELNSDKFSRQALREERKEQPFFKRVFGAETELDKEKQRLENELAKENVRGIGRTLGLEPAAEGIANLFVGGKVRKQSDEAVAQAELTYQDVFARLKEAQATGDTETADRMLDLLQQQTQNVVDAYKIYTDYADTLPTNKEAAGSFGSLAALAAPVGRIAGAVGQGLRSLGMGARAARVGGAIGAGGITGAAQDIAFQAAEGEDQLTPGLGAAAGAGIPVVGRLAAPLVPVISKITGGLVSKTGEFSRKAFNELSGQLTGTSAETLEQAFQAGKAGGDELAAFTSNINNKRTSEELVERLRDNITKVRTENQALFARGLAEFGEETVSTVAAKQAFVDSLSDFKISILDDGSLNFAKSELRTIPQAQSKLQRAYDEISRLGDTTSINEIDTARQALRNLKLAGEDASANKANSLIDQAQSAIRGAGTDEYRAMLAEFAENAEFLDELSRGVSSGNRKTVDQTFRRMITALRTNNEHRMALLRQLDEVTGGHMLSEISGQQLSELMPRGLLGRMGSGVASGAIGASLVSGGSALFAMLPAMLLGSPKAVGHFLRALGVATRKSQIIVDALDTTRKALEKAYNLNEGELIKLFAASAERLEGAIEAP